MATCQELNAKQEIGNGSQPDSERICGTGKIVCIEGGFGIIRSLNKDMIYFGENNYLPPTKGILQVLKRTEFLCFVAKPGRGHKKIKWTAVSVWKPGYEPGCQVEPKHWKAGGVKRNKGVKVKQDVEVEALSFLKSILESALSVNIKDLPAFVSQESPNVREVFLDEQKTLTFLNRHRSVFQFSDVDKNVKLISQSVHAAIRYVADVLAEHGRLDLVSVRTAVSEHSDETIASYGRKSKQLKSFLNRFPDVFNLMKEGDQWFVDLQPNIHCDLDDNESSVSSSSRATFDSTSVRPLSATFSMLSGSGNSSLHTSMSDLSVAVPANYQGISKMLNALLKKEPMPVKNLIGYIHTSPPEVRQAIGNTMEKLTNFLQNDENFFLQKPDNLVFIRSTVEKRVLKYLTELISTSKEGKVRLDDVLKFQGKHALPEVRAFLGKNVSEVSSAVRHMIAKEELMSECFLVLKDNLLSIGYSSQRFGFAMTSSNVQQLCEDKNELMTSLTDHNKDFLSKAIPGSSECKKLFTDLEISEYQAVDFLRNLLEQHDVLTIMNVMEYLWYAPAEICEILADEDLIIAFLKRHPSVFKTSGPLNLIELIDDAVRDAIAFCFNILNMKSDLRLTSLIGHMSSATLRIRKVIGGTAAKLEEFLRQYFDVFHVYEGKGGLMASSELRKHISSRPFKTVAVAQKHSAGTSALSSETGTGLVFSQAAKTVFSKEEPGDVNRCFENAGAVNEPTVRPTHEKPDSKVTTAKTSAGLDFLTGLLKMHTTVVLKDIVQQVCQASEEIQEELGCSEQEILSFVEENPAIFKISGCEFCIELISETCGDAIEFFLDVLNRRGPTPVSKLHGHLSQASSAVRNATGGSSESVKAFLLQFPNVFTSYQANGIEMIASLYEGEHVSESSDINDSVKPVVTVAGNATKNSKPIESRETPSIYKSNFDDPDFDFALTLSERSSKAIKTTAGSMLEELDFDLLPTISEKSNGSSTSADFNRLDQLDFDYIRSMSETNQFRGTETRGEVRMKLDEIEDSDESLSSDPTSGNCGSAAADIETNFLTDEKISNRAVRVDIATETHPHNVSSSSQSPPFPLKQAGVTSEDLTVPRQVDVTSVPSLVKCAKDEYNVISDLCLQALSNSNGHAVDISELLTICQKADPLHSGWQYTLRLRNLCEIISKDDRFFVNESNGSVVLVRDVEYMAAVFLRRCVLYYGPIELAKLDCYNYLSFATTEVQVLLGTAGKSPAHFRKKSIKLLCQKYQDQLRVENGVLVVPQDTESDALGFLSNLIETYGPLRVDSLPDYLPQASSLVNEFLKEKLDSLEVYLQSNGLDKQFLVWNGIVDLVRSGNLQKNRLIVENTAASFLVSEIRLGGPISWNPVSKWVDLRKAMPEVREVFGGHWNATSLKRAPLKKFCSERPDLLICQADVAYLLTDQGSDACPTDASNCKGEKSRETEQKAVQFLTDIIARRGAIGCKQKQLRSRFDLKNAPADVRALLGGQVDAVTFIKKHLQKFSLRHLTVFNTYKHSVDLKRGFCQPQPVSVISEPLQVPVQNQQKISETRNLTTEVSPLQQRFDSTVIARLPSEPPLSMPSNPLMFSDFPAAACLPATAANVLESCLPLTTSTVLTWPSFSASSPTMLCSELNKSSLISVAAPLLPQMSYFPLNQVPLTQYTYESSLGLPLNLGQPSPSVQHSLTPTGFETLPQIALYPGDTSSLIAGSLPSAIQGGVSSYAPDVLASQLVFPVVKPLGNMSTSHILPLARVSPSCWQSTPVQPVASFVSACVQPSSNAPFVDGLYASHTQPLSFATPLLPPSAQVLQTTRPLTSTSTQSLGKAPNVTQPCYGTLESAVLDSTVTHGVMEEMASEGEKLEKTGPLYGTLESAVLDSTVTHGVMEEMASEGEKLEKTGPFYGTLESAVLDSTVTHGVMEDMASEGEKLEKTGPFDGTLESAVLDSTVTHDVMEEMASEGEKLIKTGPFYSTLESDVLDSTVTHGVMEEMASEGEKLEKTGESEKANDLEVLGEPKKMNSPEDVEDLNKMESQESVGESLMVTRLAQVKDTENNEGKLFEVTQMIRTSEEPKGFSETTTNDILMEKDTETEIVKDMPCTSKSHGTLNIDDAASSATMDTSSLTEAEVAKVEAGASSPCIESSLKSLKGSSVSPVTWKSVAESAELPDFNEQFGQLFDGVSEYLSFLDEEARREDLSASFEYLSDESETDADVYETAESDFDGEGQDFEVLMGTVLSAVGNQVYVKMEDDLVVHFTPENCSKHFKQCCNLGRHFAVGESISLRYMKFPRELVSARSMCASATDDEELGTCCSNLHINLGHGRVTLSGKNYVVFMMSNQEMAGFITVNPHLFSPNDLIHFSSTKVSGFITPWRSHFMAFTNENGLRHASKIDPHSPVDWIPDSSPWRLTTDVSCQTDLACSAMQTLADNCAVTTTCHQKAQTLSTGRIMSFGCFSGE